VTEEGATVLVVDGDEDSRAQLLAALRHVGLHALGVPSANDAGALLLSLDADLVLLHGGGADDATIALLSNRSRLVRVPRGTPLTDIVVALLNALGRAAQHSLVN
jgi:hypothetical protein